MPEKAFRSVLDEEKLETLRRWGEGLTRDAREEVAAAGRAILMLAEEVKRLHVNLWTATQLFPQGDGGSPTSHRRRRSLLPLRRLCSSG